MANCISELFNIENKSFEFTNGLNFYDDALAFDGYVQIFNYPCSDTASCYPYNIILPKGIYLIELYGASGGSYLATNNAKRLTKFDTINDSEIYNRGGNAIPKVLGSSAGAGAYVRGVLSLKRETKVFLHIGGKGEYVNVARPRGGYNGGGRGMTIESKIGGGGGGATDLRFEVDDPWHRVMVAAGGGGADDSYEDDGSGGCGGDPDGQGMWYQGEYKGEKIATQTSGFSFFQGEASQENRSQNPNGYDSPDKRIVDKPGAGGGWFGGFARHYGGAGAGGGSSFVLHSSAVIPKGNIEVRDENYENPVSKPYAFDTSSEYCFTDFEMFGGIWSGNGMARIMFISEHPLGCETKKKSHKYLAVIFAVFFI